MRMSVAFVIAVFNGVSTIEKTLDSLASQGVRPDEVVVFDGGSTDGTVDILARRSDTITYWHSGPDAGIYDAWNRALAHVSADWVAFLGADDYLHGPEVIRRMSEFAMTAPAETPFIYGRLQEVSSDGVVLSESGAPWALLSKKFRHSMTLPHPGMWHRRSILFNGSGFDASYRIAGDYALLRPALLRAAPTFVDFVVAAAQEGGVSTRADRRVSSVVETGRAIRTAGERRPLAWYGVLTKNWLRWQLWRLVGDGGLLRLRRILGMAHQAEKPAGR